MKYKKDILIIIVIVELLVAGNLLIVHFKGKIRDDSQYKFLEKINISLTEINFATYSPQREPPLGLKPNFSQNIFESKVEINSDGFRDKEYSIEKPNNTLRIIALGDSETFGWGLNISEVWTEVLERRLNSKSQRNFQVLNFGVGGYNTEMEVEMLRNKGLKYKPDLVILQYLFNDLLNKTRQRVLALSIKDNLKGEEFTEDQKYFMAYKRAKEHILLKKRKENVSKRMKLVEKSLNVLNDLAKKNGFEVIIFNIESPLSEKRHLRELSEDLGFRFFDFETMIDSYPDEKKYISEVNPHKSALIHSKIANRLFKEFKFGEIK